jgi:hypothetical protein
MKNGKGTIAPGSGMHFVSSEFNVYPSSHITFDGSHCVPEVSISYPNGHCKPSRIHLVEFLRSVTNPVGHVVEHVKLANKYPFSHLSQFVEELLQLAHPVSHFTH